MKDVYRLPVIVVDSHTGNTVYRTTYDKRHLARQVRERKNQAYGAYRFITKTLAKEAE